MFGIKIMTKSTYHAKINENFGDLLNQIGDIAKEKNDLITKIDHLNFDIDSKNKIINRYKRSLDSLAKDLKQSLENETYFKNSLSSLIEKWTFKSPKNDIVNIEIISQLEKVYSNMFKTIKEQAFLLTEMAEKSDIKTIEKIQKYIDNI